MLSLTRLCVVVHAQPLYGRLYARLQCERGLDYEDRTPPPSRGKHHPLRITRYRVIQYNKPPHLVDPSTDVTLAVKVIDYT